MAETVEVAGLVTARNDAETGIRINDGAWLNFTKDEYAKEPFEKEGAVKGARVVCQVKDNKWIQSIAVVGDEPEEPELPFNGEDEPLAQKEPVYGLRDELQRNRETALNAAAWVGVSLAGDAEERGGKILYIAGLFEDWLSRGFEPEVPFE